MKRHSFLSLSIFILFASLQSCTSKSENSAAVYKALTEGLNYSITSARNQSEYTFYVLQEKMNNPQTAEKARIWLPRAAFIKKEADQMFTYLEDLEGQLKQETELSAELPINNKTVVKRIFIKEKRGEELYRKMQQFKVNLLMTDPLIRNEFQKTILLFGNNVDAADSDSTSLNRIYFENISSAEALALLEQFQLNVSMAELKITQFCNEQFTNHIIFDPAVFSVISQSSSAVVPGGEIEIMAGFGLSRILPMSSITIDDKVISPLRDGNAHYKLKAPTTPGNYFVPIRLEYTDQDGRLQFLDKQLGYTVVQPCQQ